MSRDAVSFFLYLGRDILQNGFPEMKENVGCLVREKEWRGVMWGDINESKDLLAVCCCCSDMISRFCFWGLMSGIGVHSSWLIGLNEIELRWLALNHISVSFLFSTCRTGARERARERKRGGERGREREIESYPRSVVSLRTVNYNSSYLLCSGPVHYGTH